MELSLDPGVLAALAVAEWLYLRALRILRGRGVTVPLAQKLFWHTALALWLVAIVGFGAYADEGLTPHMAEHVLIADISAPLLLAGLRNPVLGFYLPRPVLVTFARQQRLRSVFRVLRRPLVAVPVWIVVLYGWHYGVPFEAAVRNPAVHALQHACFVGAGMLVWWSALEPQRRRLRGELWKIPYIFGARLPAMMLGMGFIFVRVPLYEGVYGTGERAFGLDAIADQQIAGGLMMTTDILIVVFALCFFFYRAAQDAEEERPAALTRP